MPQLSMLLVFYSLLMMGFNPKKEGGEAFTFHFTSA